MARAHAGTSGAEAVARRNGAVEHVPVGGGLDEHDLRLLAAHAVRCEDLSHMETPPRMSPGELLSWAQLARRLVRAFDPTDDDDDDDDDS